MSRKTRRKSGVATHGVVHPEREQHGRVRLSAEQIADADGAIGRPYVTRDLLCRMFDDGRISADMLAAAEAFRRAFRSAHLDQARAADMGRLSGLGRPHDEPYRVTAARRAVGDSMELVGDPGDSCLWHVVGLEWSISEWRRQQEQMGRAWHPMQASGILIAALGALASAQGRSAPRIAATPAADVRAVRAARLCA